MSGEISQSRVRPNIVLNPLETEDDCDRTEPKSVRPSIVTFQIPQSDSDKGTRQRGERFVFIIISTETLKYNSRAVSKTERANVMVTSGALIFILIAATLVTATFLMSPAIENAFGQYELPVSVAIFLKLSYFSPLTFYTVF